MQNKMASGIALLLVVIMLSHASCFSQPLNGEKKLTHQDTLRGTIGPERAWWDVQHYTVEVTPNYGAKTIQGKTKIDYKVLAGQQTDYMQIDLQQPLMVDTIFYDNKLYINYPAKPYKQEGNVWHIPLPRAKPQSEHSITIAYHGTPREARRAPWDGGWVFAKDAMGRPWMTVACQGLGASVWYACKDHQSDEPDQGAQLIVHVPDSLVAVGNGKMLNMTKANGWATYTWEVKNPINSYNLVPYIGKYVNFSESFAGEKGNLNMSYWVLDYNVEKAKSQFKQAPMTIKAYEHWFGPYPWYEDDFKLVEAPHLGMEHQSAVAYGNKYQNGYLGRDLSGTGVGLKWDYIIVHEVGHEWFGNNITSKDIADMWVHEGFTTYAETLFVDYTFGLADGDKYNQGERRSISNDIPIIGKYGVNQEGSGDMYAKGSSMLHTIRHIINDDEKFRSILRGLNKDFYHQTVTSAQVEKYISDKSGYDFSKVFDQYLRSTTIPVLEYKTEKDKLYARWTNCIPNFTMPVQLGETGHQMITPTTEWTEVKLPKDFTETQPNRNWFVGVKKA